MKLLICLVVSGTIITLLEEVFKKRPYILYVGALILGLVGMNLPSAVSNYITRGTLGTSLFIIVMYARILPVKSRLYKTFMSLRAPIAIAGSFLILIHNGRTLASYIRAYVLHGTILKNYECFAACCSAIMFALLIPLTITSFMPVRKKMNPKKWKNLQRTSYIFYALIYCHVAFLFGYQVMQGKTNYALDLAIYTFIFGSYLFQRVGLYLKRINFKIAGETFVTILSVLILGFGIYGSLKPQSKELAQKELAIKVASTQESFAYADGEYIGVALGYNGDVTIKVIIENGEIADLKFVDYVDEDDYFIPAWNKIKEEVLAAQITDVDGVSGATYSSNGIKQAIANALDNAKTGTN